MSRKGVKIYMKITLAKSAGFCFGVARAVKTVESLLASEKDSRICTLGALIHNPIVVRAFESRGVTVVTEEELEQLCAEAKEEMPVVVVVRTHGVERRISERLAEMSAANPNFRVTDCTCPYVKKIHKIARETSEACETEPGGAMGIIIGDAQHPEVKGIRSYFSCPTKIYADAEAIDTDTAANGVCEKDTAKCAQSACGTDVCSESAGDVAPPVILVSQTTQKLTEFKKCQKKLKKLYTNVLIFDTICTVTENRQRETEEIAARSDLMLIVGGKDSSNTRKLYEIGKKWCRDTFLVEDASEVPLSLVTSKTRVGITAGASTPNGIIEEVIKMVNEAVSPEENFEQLLDESFKTLNTGDVVKGIITSISPNEIHVDIDSKVTGILAYDDITDDPLLDVAATFKVGDEIEAVVTRVSDADGVATLSKKKIDNENNWHSIVKAYEDGEILTGKIVETMEKGLIIVVHGMKVFIPASHSGLPRGADLSTLRGTVQRVKIIEVNEQRKRAVASIREVLKAERKEKEAAFWQTIEAGKQYEGVVKSFMPYGAFIDLGGVDGMVHLSELSWQRIKHPSEVLNIGDTVTVYVKDFDPDAKRISLGYKTEETDPWRLFESKYAEGDIVSVKILNMMPFGAFAEIIPGADGLIHISQIADHRIANPAEVLSKGQVVDAKIIGIDYDHKKISLSIRAAVEDARSAEEASYLEDYVENGGNSSEA